MKQSLFKIRHFDYRNQIHFMCGPEVAAKECILPIQHV